MLPGVATWGAWEACHYLAGGEGVQGLDAGRAHPLRDVRSVPDCGEPASQKRHVVGLRFPIHEQENI